MADNFMKFRFYLFCTWFTYSFYLFYLIYFLLYSGVQLVATDLHEIVKWSILNLAAATMFFY